MSNERATSLASKPDEPQASLISNEQATSSEQVKSLGSNKQARRAMSEPDKQQVSHEQQASNKQ